MTQGRPTPAIIRNRIITLLMSDAYKSGDINAVIIAKRTGCTRNYVQSIRSKLIKQ